MQAGGSRIEPDITGNDRGGGDFVQPLSVGQLVDVAAAIKQAKQIRFVCVHNVPALNSVERMRLVGCEHG